MNTPTEKAPIDMTDLELARWLRSRPADVRMGLPDARFRAALERTKSRRRELNAKHAAHRAKVATRTANRPTQPVSQPIDQQTGAAAEAEFRTLVESYYRRPYASLTAAHDKAIAEDHPALFRVVREHRKFGGLTGQAAEDKFVSLVCERAGIESYWPHSDAFLERHEGEIAKQHPELFQAVAEFRG